MPKFGELQASEPWAAATRTLTDFSAEQVFDLPALDAWAPSSQGFVVSGAGADLFGAWAQLVANVGVGKRLIEIAARTSVVCAAEIQVGDGGAGNEVTIGRQQGVWAANSVLRMQFWLTLTNNSRLSFRVRTSEAVAVEFYVAPVIG